jgi:hypothetical protein
VATQRRNIPWLSHQTDFAQSTRTKNMVPTWKPMFVVLEATNNNAGSNV